MFRHIIIINLKAPQNEGLLIILTKDIIWHIITIVL